MLENYFPYSFNTLKEGNFSIRDTVTVIINFIKDSLHWFSSGALPLIIFVLYSWFSEHLSNGDIPVKEEEEIPLISFEDPELLDSTNKPHPPETKEPGELFRKRLLLLLSKGVFFALGAMLFAAGCILFVSFRHGDVDEMCVLDDGHNITYGNFNNSSFSHSLGLSSLATLPSPTSTVTSQFDTLITLVMSSSVH